MDHSNWDVGFSRPQCTFAHRMLRTGEDETPSETDSPRVSHESKSPVRAGPARAKDAGVCSWTIRATHKGQESPSSAPRHRRSLPAERRASASRVKGTAKIGLSMLTCPGSIGCVPPELLCVVEAFGGYVGSGDIWGKTDLRTSVRHRWSAFAVGRHFVTLPVLGFQGQLHQPPAQEKHSGLVTRTSISASRWRSALWSPVTASIRR